MNRDDFSDCLIRLNKYQIGIGEAVVLFLIGDGITKYEIAEKTRLSTDGAKAVIGALRRKGACRTVYDENSKSKYVLTDEGKRIISQTLDQKP